MKQIACFFLLLASFAAKAQDFSGLENVQFSTAEECRAYDGKALECANYLLSTANAKDDMKRLVATSFIIKWMTATADYHFSLDKPVMQLSQKNDAVLALLMAAITKFVLENKEKANEAGLVLQSSVKMLIDYCKNESNNIKLTKELKKTIKADEEGKLAEYLKQ